MNSFKVMVNTAGDPPDSWASNSLRFSSEAEANGYGKDLAWRWTAVRVWRVEPSDDPVSASFIDGKVIYMEDDNA